MPRPSVILTVALLLACASERPPAATEPDPPWPHVDPPADGTGLIVGRLRHNRYGMGLPRALVIAECTCLASARETLTDRDGFFQLRDLPPGRYSITMLFRDGRDNIHIVIQPGARFRMNRLIDPDFRFRVDIE